MGVPHVYSKIYDYPVICNDVKTEFKVITSVRYLDFTVIYNLSRMEKEMQNEGIVIRRNIGNGKKQFSVSLLKVMDVKEFLIDKLSDDPYYLLHHPPLFESGQIPFDGVAGPENTSLSRKT